MNRSALALASFALSSVLAAQGMVFVPDNQATAGVCNAIPLSASFASSSTYAGRIPASFLNPAETLIDDIALASCAAGTFSATSLQMGIGHVPTPAPSPFLFPTIDAGGNVTSNGSFLDYRPLWNSVTQGSFSYTFAANTWSPFGFASTGGTGFVWNGTNDIAFFITFSGATGGGSFHRTATEPLRLYSSGTYKAASAASSGAAGLKMELLTRPATTASIVAVGTGCPGTGAIVPVLGTTALPFLGNLAFHLDVSQGAAGAASLLYLSLGLSPAPIPVTGACTLYLEYYSLVALTSTGLFPLGPVILDPSGAGVFLLGVPNDPGLGGLHVGFQALVLDAGAPDGVTLTNALEATLN